MKTYRAYIANVEPENLARSASLQFGGATVTPGIGAWTDDDGNTFIEPTNVVTIAADERNDVVAWAIRYALIIGESAVLVEDPGGVASIVYTDTCNTDWTGC